MLYYAPIIRAMPKSVAMFQHSNLRLILHNDFKLTIDFLGSVVVRVMDSYSCSRFLSPAKGKTALNNIQFISDESFVELALYLFY